jgi:hypothetical protein
MKVLITEDRRRELANKVLDDTLSKLTRKDIDLNKGKNSVFSNHRVMFKDSDGESVLKWSEHNNGLYVYSDFWLPLSVFSFGEIELERIIFRWFKDRIKIEPDEVYLMGFDSED